MDKSEKRIKTVGGTGGKSLPNLERREESRKTEKEHSDDRMSDAEYHEAARREYGKGKWADRLIKDLEKKREKKER